MGQIICVMNQKGGVGKTTTAINLGACFARAGFQTLIIDFDPQCNATSGLDRKPIIRHPLVTGDTLKDSIVPSDWTKLFILPGCKSFKDVSTLNTENSIKTQTIDVLLRQCSNFYDYILIDSPPAISPLTKAALESANEIIMPIQCEFFAMEGISKMTSLISREQWDSSWILLTMVDPLLELTREVEAEVRDYFGDVVLQTVIPRDVVIPEASSYGKPVIEYAPRSRGARAYIELCMEVLENEQEE